MHSAMTPDSVWARFPAERIDLDSRAYFEGLLKQELRINRCDVCGYWHHPPRPICPACWSFAITPTQVGGTGIVELAMVLQQGPDVPDVRYPYPVVAVGLDEQKRLRVTSMLIDAVPPVDAIGLRVELCWLARGGAPWPAFRSVSHNEAV